MDKINIRGLEVRCIIGTKPIERENAQKVVIDISLECDFSKAAKTDHLADTVNYKELKDGILDMASGSKFFLLEKFTEKVADLCLSKEGVKSARISAEKPGALTGARTVGVEIVRARQ